jgi:translation elongation factor EF-4
VTVVVLPEGLTDVQVRDHVRNRYGVMISDGEGSTAPNVVYRVVMEDGKEIIVTNPSEFPSGKIAEVHEPVVKASI